MRPTGSRPTTAGPDSGPEPPYPVLLQGPVVSGFGRGSKELGIPTANIPIDGLPDTIESGIYYGWSALALPPSECAVEAQKGEGTLLPMVMSVGWNPFYKNEVRSAEVHIIHKFPKDFYGVHMNVLVLGYIRPEYDYVSVDALIEDIRTDIKVAEKSLERPPYAEYQNDVRLRTFPAKNEESQTNVELTTA